MLAMQYKAINNTLEKLALLLIPILAIVIGISIICHPIIPKIKNTAYIKPGHVFYYKSDNPFKQDTVFIYITDKKSGYVEYVTYFDSLPQNYRNNEYVSKKLKHSMKAAELWLSYYNYYQPTIK